MNIQHKALVRSCSWRALVILFFLVSPIPVDGQWQTEDTRISNTPGSSLSTWAGGGWSIAADSNDVHVVWEDFTNIRRVRYLKFPIGIPPTGPDSGYPVSSDVGHTPVVATDGNQVQVSWYKVLYGLRSREYDGMMWDSVIHHGTSNPVYPAIAYDVQSNTHCLFNQAVSSGYEVLYQIKEQGSDTFGDPVLVYKSSAHSRFPSIAITSDGHIHTAFTYGAFPFSLYYSYSDDNGKTWSEPVTAAVDVDPFTAPSLCTDNACNLYAAYRSSYAPYNIYVVRQTGGSWGAAEMVSSGNGYSHDNPSLCCDSWGNVWVVWCEYRSSTNYNYEIFYNRRDALTGIWDGAQQLTASDNRNSRWPHIACDWTGGVHACWCDERDGKEQEIYYNYHGASGPPSGLDLFMAHIIRPGAQELPGIPFTPSCRIWNNQDTLVRARVSCSITDLQTDLTVYEDVLDDHSLESGYSVVEDFSSFTPEQDKTYEAYFEVYHPDDVNENNDFKYQLFITHRLPDVTPYEVVRPEAVEDSIFSPQVWVAERSGLETPDVSLFCEVENITSGNKVYGLSLSPRDFSAYDTQQVIFPPVTNLGTNQDYMITFWATDSSGEEISYPRLSQLFRYTGTGIAEICSLKGVFCTVGSNLVSQTASVQFGLDQSTQVCLKVYDVAGKLIDELAADYFPLGLYKVTWDVSQVATGVYFIRFVSDELNTTSKVVVLH